MAAFRSLLFVLFQIVSVIPWGFTVVVLSPVLPLHWRYRLAVGWPSLMVKACRVLCGIRWQVIGVENLPNGPAIICPKHQSAWETLFLPAWMPRDLCFVYKRELNWIPFFGWAFAALRMIPIDRSRGQDAFESIVRQGTQRLAEGRWIIMFPEGTRTPVGSQGRYKTGSTRLAVRMQTPVVPIALNSGEVWPRNAFIKRPGLITISIGPPIPAVGESPESLMRKVESWIESEMRRISPHVYENTTASGSALGSADGSAVESAAESEAGSATPSRPAQSRH